MENSEEFMKGYLEQFTVIQQSYYMILFKDSNNLSEDAVVDGELDIEKFMEEKDTYPRRPKIGIGRHD